MEQQMLQEKQWRLQSLWRESVLPAIVAAAGPLADRPAVEVRAGLLRRDVWLEARNKTRASLTNCTLNLRIRQGEHGPADLVWFIPEWPANTTIHPEYFPGWIHALPGEEQAKSRGLSVEYDFWCDPSHSSSALAKIVDGYYLIRDPFVEKLFGSKAQYVTTSSTDRTTLEFRTIKKTGTSRTVEAVIRTESLVGGGKTATNYEGVWTEDKNDTYYSHPAGPGFRMSPSQAEGNPKGKEKGRRPLRNLMRARRTVAVQWLDGCIKLTPQMGAALTLTPFPSVRSPLAQSHSLTPAVHSEATVPSWLPFGRQYPGTFSVGDNRKRILWEVVESKDGVIRLGIVIPGLVVMEYKLKAVPADDASSVRIEDIKVGMSSKQSIQHLGDPLDLRVVRGEGRVVSLSADLEIEGQSAILILSLPE